MYKPGFCDELKFEASTILLSENQNIVTASGKVKIFLNNKTEISGEKFIYNKIKSFGTIEDSVVIKDNLNDLEIYSDKIEYFKADEIIKSNSPTQLIYKNNYKLKLNNFYYNRKSSIIKSDTKSFLTDNLGNNFSVDDFIFNVNENLFKSNSLKYKDYE